jgi:uncharacterized MAPEG superfamily protein
MTVPFYCLAIVCFLPYVWFFVSIPERQKQLGRVDNKDPRVQQALLTGRGARAIAAHKNAFEAIAIFAPAVIVAHLAGADPAWSSRLAQIFVSARLLHGIFYLLDLDLLRTGIFGVGLACDVGLFALAAQAVP